MEPIEVVCPFCNQEITIVNETCTCTCGAKAEVVSGDLESAIELAIRRVRLPFLTAEENVGMWIDEDVCAIWNKDLSSFVISVSENVHVVFSE